MTKCIVIVIETVFKRRKPKLCNWSYVLCWRGHRYYRHLWVIKATRPPNTAFVWEPSVNLDIFVNWKFTILGRRINSSNLSNVESFVRKRAIIIIIIIIIIIFCFPQRFVNKALKHLQTMLMHIKQKLTHKTRVRFLYAVYLSEYCIYSGIVFLLYLQSELTCPFFF